MEWAATRFYDLAQASINYKDGSEAMNETGALALNNGDLNGGASSGYEAENQSNPEVFEPTLCCLHTDTIIETDSGMKKISEIVAGDKVKHMNGKLMNVKFNLKFCKTNKFIKLPTDCFGENTPNKDTFIVDGHPIFVDGKEVQPRDFLSKNGVEEVLLDNYVNVYSLCTDERTFFKVNGDLAVCTWEENECAEKYGYTYWKQ